MLSYVLIFVLLFYKCELNTIHGKHVIVNGSIEKVQLTNDSVKEEQTKRVNPPPIAEVIHGKVNSVIHEIRGSIDDIPTLLSDAKQKDGLLSPTHLEHNSVTDVGIQEVQLYDVQKWNIRRYLLSPSPQLPL